MPAATLDLVEICQLWNVVPSHKPEIGNSGQIDASSSEFQPWEQGHPSLRYKQQHSESLA